MRDKLTETGRFILNTAADNKAKLEVFGQLFRFVTPLLITVGLYLMTQMTDTLKSIEDDVIMNKEGVIVLRANQKSAISSLVTFRKATNRQLDEIDNEIDEVNDELDSVTRDVYRLEVEVKGNHAGSSRP